MSSFRYKLVIACVSFCFLVIAGRLAYVQLFEGFKHAAAVRNNNQPDVNVLRSEIVDRNNKVLA